jgi:peptide/nickel transport system substrate-binding protein
MPVSCQPSAFSHQVKTPLHVGRHAGLLVIILTLASCGLLVSCSHRSDPDELVMIIESSPSNLDPRIGLDAWSEQIDGLIFDNLLARDEHLGIKPGLAESWEIPDPRTYLFHLRRGVRFSDGRALTSRDVKWSFDSVLQGLVRSPKASTYRFVESIAAPDDYTVVFHLKQPWAALPWNVAGGEGMGIVPYGSRDEIAGNPIGSGPFRVVRAEQDREVIIERNDNYWGQRAKLGRVRFTVVPDPTTRALELRKGSADLEINALAGDTVLTLEREPKLGVLRGPGTRLGYIAFNLRDPILKDARVRQAIAYAIDRPPMIHYLVRDMARLASSVLPPESWAFDNNVTQYPHDPSKARELLEEAFPAGGDGIRFHLVMKTSTEESSRAMAAVLQQQLREVGIALDIRSFESATFFSDVTHGEFQMYSLRWVGGNEDPDIFGYAFHSANIIPHGANRQFYSSPRVDTLIEKAQTETDQAMRKRDYAEVQRILSHDLPYVYLWYFDNVMVYSKRVRNLGLNPSGNYDFLKTAELQASR